MNGLLVLAGQRKPRKSRQLTQGQHTVAQDVLDELRMIVRLLRYSNATKSSIKMQSCPGAKRTCARQSERWLCAP